MSSLFRARRPEEPRSGGKMLRGWRATPSSASPYARPPEGSPPVGQSGSPRWLSGLISGAGKLISSVLPSYRSSESPSSDSSVYSSDEEETSSGFNENEEELQRSNQEGNESEFVNQCMNGQLAVVPKNEAKLAIEQLLMQESFSREECDKLTKLIQSRVVDFPSPEVCGNGIEELRSRTTGSDTLPGALLSFRQRTLSERVPYSSSKMNGFSHRPSLFEACTPDICNKAVSEAKKWLEEKKLASKPKYDSECGPCTLNTDMLQYGIESEAGSPVDMAKTYMRSLPPWKSPSFSGVGFKTPPPSGMRCYKDETSYENSDNSLTLSRGLKRGHLFIESWDTLDETRRVRLKSIDDTLEIAKSKATESSARLSKHESSKSLSDSDKRELDCRDRYANGAFRLPDEKEADANRPFETGNISSLNILPQQEEIIEAVHSTPAISVRSTHPQEPTQSLDENQPSQTIKEVDNVSVPHDTLAPASSLMEPDGNPASEIKVMPIENIKSAVPSDADDVANLDVPISNRETSSGVEGTALSDSSSQLNPVSGIAERNCISDSRKEDGNPHIPMKKNGSINELSANGSSSEVNTNSNHETLSKGTDTIMPQNGTKKKSIERVLTEPQPRATTSRRGRKMVVKSRRGRKS